MDNLQRLSMDHQHYVEITTRIRSLRNFCEFLTTAVIRDQPEGAPWRDITAAMMERERYELGQLERLRSRLYPDLSEEDISPPLYSH